MSKNQIKAAVIDHPSAWKVAFQSQAMRSSFALALSQPMLELLCAIADGVYSDRQLHYRSYGIARPDSLLASSRSLEKRGLIQPVANREERIREAATARYGEVAFWELTPAGAAVVELLKVGGIFIEADAAIAKKARAK